jgi:hypothetical protein
MTPMSLDPDRCPSCTRFWEECVCGWDDEDAARGYTLASISAPQGAILAETGGVVRQGNSCPLTYQSLEQRVKRQFEQAQG